MEKQAADILASSRPHPTAHPEVELRLLASPAAIERIRADPVMARHARNRGVVRRLDTVYYDTPDRALFRHRSSLRVRRNGTHYVQSLKLACADGSPFVRQQWEARVTTPAPDLARLPAEINGALSELAEDGLAPIFLTRLRRHLQRLAFDSAEVEIVFDEGTVEAGEHGQPLIEIELKLKCGDSSALYDLGMQLLDVAPLRLGTLSKADRGYALAFDAVPQATRAERSGISAKHCVDDVIAMVMSAAQQHLLANQAVLEYGRGSQANISSWWHDARRQRRPFFKLTCRKLWLTVRNGLRRCIGCLGRPDPPPGI